MALMGANNHLAFIGGAGIPNRYGGFESFTESCCPAILDLVGSVTVTCDASLYPDKRPAFSGVRRVFISVRANGASSILHDLVAFLAVFRNATHIIVLGVSGGVWFPLFRLLCDCFGKRLLVNVDGLEWRRTKFSRVKRMLLRVFDGMAQLFAHTVIYDNVALRDYLPRFSLQKAVQIGYPGDHAVRLPEVSRARRAGTGLTICRIEPENNVEMLIDGALRSRLLTYIIVGNWDGSEYGRCLRKRYVSEKRLMLMDPIYDAYRLAELREGCESYLHGHTVGGTNPSLVEMLFYDSKIFCYDVPFHHETAGSSAYYFGSPVELGMLLDSSPEPDLSERVARRAAFSRHAIAAKYIAAMD